MLGSARRFRDVRGASGSRLPCRRCMPHTCGKRRSFVHGSTHSGQVSAVRHHELYRLGFPADKGGAFQTACPRMGPGRPRLLPGSVQYADTALARASAIHMLLHHCRPTGHLAHSVAERIRQHGPQREAGGDKWIVSDRRQPKGGRDVTLRRKPRSGPRKSSHA